MFQGGPPHEPYFIGINNREQVIISPNKKTVATYVVGKLEVLIHENMNVKTGVLL